MFDAVGGFESCTSINLIIVLVQVSYYIVVPFLLWCPGCKMQPTKILKNHKHHSPKTTPLRGSSSTKTTGIVPVVASFTFFFRKHVEVFESHQFLVLKNNGSSDSIENRKTMHWMTFLKRPLFYIYYIPSLKLTKPLKMDGWNYDRFLLRLPIFRGGQPFSFREWFGVCFINNSRKWWARVFDRRAWPDEFDDFQFSSCWQRRVYVCKGCEWIQCVLLIISMVHGKDSYSPTGMGFHNMAP